MPASLEGVLNSQDCCLMISKNTSKVTQTLDNSLFKELSVILARKQVHFFFIFYLKNILILELHVEM